MDPLNLTSTEQTQYVALFDSDSSYQIADLVTYLNGQSLTATLLVNWYSALQTIQREHWIEQIRLWLSEIGGGG